QAHVEGLGLGTGQVHPLLDVGAAAEHPRSPLLEVQLQLVAPLLQEHAVAPFGLLGVGVDDRLVVHGGSLRSEDVANAGVRARGNYGRARPFKRRASGRRTAEWDCRNAEGPAVCPWPSASPAEVGGLVGRAPRW